MVVDNKPKVVKLKRLFFIISVAIAVIALTLFLLDYTVYGIACVGVFALWFLYFQVADYQYIRFSDENNKILVRFYKAVKFGKPEFRSIEFPQEMLRNARFENSVFGEKSDLTLLVKTRRGMAEYPSVSLSALSKKERREIHAALNKVLGV